MAKEQVAARLQRVKEALHEFAFTLFRKIDENIHAENQVHLADVDGIGKIHLDEINHFVNSWPYLMCASNRREMCRELPFAYACDGPPGIRGAFGDIERLPTDVRRQNFDVPCIRKGQRVRDSDGDRIRLFARRTAGAPDSQRPRILPEFLDVQFRQDALFESFVHAGIAKKRRLLREQSLEQRLVVRRRLSHCAQKLRAAFVTLRLHVLAHTRGEESLARLVERDSRAFVNEHADLTQLVLGQTDLVPQALAHRHSARVTGLRRSRELPPSAERLLGRDARIPLMRWLLLLKLRGIATALRSAGQTI